MTPSIDLRLSERNARLGCLFPSASALDQSLLRAPCWMLGFAHWSLPKPVRLHIIENLKSSCNVPASTDIYTAITHVLVHLTSLSKNFLKMAMLRTHLKNRYLGTCMSG